MHKSEKSSTFAPAFDESTESCLSGRKSHTRNVVYALCRTGGSNPSLSASRILGRVGTANKGVEIVFSTFFVPDSLHCKIAYKRRLSGTKRSEQNERLVCSTNSSEYSACQGCLWHQKGYWGELPQARRRPNPSLSAHNKAQPIGWALLFSSIMLLCCGIWGILHFGFVHQCNEVVPTDNGIVSVFPYLLTYFFYINGFSDMTF